MANSYAPVGYQAGFGLILVLQLLGLAWFLMVPVMRPTPGDHGAKVAVQEDKWGG